MEASDELTLEDIDLSENDTLELDTIHEDVSDDHPVTTRKELWGFYAYEAGVQPFSR